MNETKTKLGLYSRLMLFVSSALLVVSIFVPIWKIELDAPQYPEGLTLKIFSNKLGGEVEIINGLNHYIGMKTLHAEDFIEFTLLPYLIGFFALFSLIAAVLGRKKILYTLLTIFILFGIVAMIDFWRWEYNYGHHLDPNAAIIVPGMAYQPPLIGFKQLLNFGAYSIPDVGGWLFIGSGVLMLVSTLIESGFLAKFRKPKLKTATMCMLLISFISCNTDKPREIKLNIDECAYCKMTISDGKFAAEGITHKGRIYIFDDIACLLNYEKENPQTPFKKSFISNFHQQNKLLEISKANYAIGGNIQSPMGGNIAAFETINEAKEFANKFQAETTNWETLKNQSK